MKDENEDRFFFSTPVLENEMETKSNQINLNLMNLNLDLFP